MAMQQHIAAAMVPAAPLDTKQPLATVTPVSPVSPVSAPPLPAGWFEMKDPSGRTMYFNSANGTTSWQRPMVRQLPPGWIKTQTPDGKPMYFDTATQQCSFQFPTSVVPSQPLAAVPSSPVANPSLVRKTSMPVTPATAHSIPASPAVRRSATMPVHAAHTASSVAAGVNPALVNMALNTAAARKNIPGFDEALAIHQLAQRNNTRVLGKKLGADVAQAGVALKDTTITAASLATRQAIAVGQTMASKTKMQKVSRKAIVQTGALGVKIGRASKSLMHEMVEAADGRGKYKPKHRAFVPQDPLPGTVGKLIQGGQHGEGVEAYGHEHAVAVQHVQQVQQVQQVQPVQQVQQVQQIQHVQQVQPLQSLQQTPVLPRSMSTVVPRRKPLKQTSVSASAASETTATTATMHNPPSHSLEANSGAESLAQATQDVNVPGSGHPEQGHYQQPSTTPLQQAQEMQCQSQSPTPATPLELQLDASGNPNLTYQPQSTGSAPPPYTPQMQNISSNPALNVQPQPQQQPGQPIFIQQQQQDSGADPVSTMIALQQQMQALQMQQQAAQQPVYQQQTVAQPDYQQQSVMQPDYQQQSIMQPDYQQIMQQPQPATPEDVYFVDDTANVQTTADGGAVYQQQQQISYLDGNNNAVYAQETTTEVYAPDGSMVYADDSIVYQQDDVSGAGGDVYYAQNDEMGVYDLGDGSDAGGSEDVESVDAGSDFDCDF